MIYEKLQKCRCELQTMNLKKSGKNKFAGFSYYELSDILPAINSLFLKYKLCSNFSIEGEQANLIIYDWEDIDSTIIFTSPTADLELKGCTAVQSLGGVHTYLKRYLYLNALEIVEADMLDASVGKLENDDSRIYAEIEKCDNLETLSKLFKTYEKQVVDRDKLVKACGKRKEQLNNGK